jgi:tetratricopeptide (TPR) repeat protein
LRGLTSTARRARRRFVGQLMLGVALGGAALAQPPLESARTLLAAWHDDPARIDRARALLEAEAASSPSVDTLVELSGAWFLTGEFRAQSERERLTAYEQGSRAARRAIAMAPGNERAHLLLAFNSGRTAEITGVMRALALVSTIRDESSTVLRLNPSSVEGLILAGGLAAGLPAMMGGDRTKAEQLFTRALELDPHHTGGRVELARLYIAQHRWSEAARELQAVLDDAAPTDLPRWATRDRPRALALLGELRDRGRVPALAPQSP